MIATLIVLTYLLGIFVTVWLYDWLEYLTDGINPTTPTFGECLLKLIIGFFWPIAGFWWVCDYFREVKKWRKEYLENRNRN